MLKRIITGIILILAALFWIYSKNDMVFEAGIVVIMLAGGWEFGRFLTDKDESGVRKFNPAVQGAYAVLVTGLFLLLVHLVVPMAELVTNLKSATAIIASYGAINVLFYLTSLWWMFVLLIILKYSFGEKAIRNKALRFVAGLLTLMPLGVALYILRYQSGIASTAGSTCLIAVMVLVWCADSGAYFTGKALGKHKMCPRISPNKTIEGLAGGVVLSILVFVGFYCAGLYGDIYSSNIVALSFAAVCTTIISVFGDLIESVYKREAGIKDSGRIFPGHGGMLDRVDSLSAAIPIFVIVYALVDSIMKSA